jgi:hypothetical protein
LIVAAAAIIAFLYLMYRTGEEDAMSPQGLAPAPTALAGAPAATGR